MARKTRRKGGWYRESGRHALAARGIKTARDRRVPVRWALQAAEKEGISYEKYLKKEEMSHEELKMEEEKMKRGVDLFVEEMKRASRKAVRKRFPGASEERVELLSEFLMAKALLYGNIVDPDDLTDPYLSFSDALFGFELEAVDMVTGGLDDVYMESALEGMEWPSRDDDEDYYEEMFDWMGGGMPAWVEWALELDASQEQQKKR